MTDTTPTPDDNGDNQDALSEAEAILNEEAARAQAETQSEADAFDSDLAAAEAKAAEHFADLQRLQAEFVNYRKRVDRDREAMGEQATAKVIESLIPVLDDVLKAREHGDLEDGPFASIAVKLEDALGRLGWSSFGAEGDEFDPNVHEALTSQASADVSVPTVQLVAQPGHRIGDRVVRPARVIVAQPE
ncbi:nucleotide exchange factor GrpE [Demequina sp. B12]|uniref:nucleotide exchange factor GrpE n=1 Tax=Demequina sp. B12 TaxID=2992757 RepID=UPI00237A7CED|nr:nucleotide exchange factor GrpE [Demequina sp. B12]MDE0572294.1 nucleotide exchange factor GrpE [Demequina sp. B12]